MDVNSLSHTKWDYKYHTAFAQKYNRRKVIYGHLHKDISQIFSMLCNRKGIRIIEAEMCPNHAHMLVEI